MLGQAGYLTDTPDEALDDMIEVVKGIEPPIGYGPILSLSEMEVGDAHEANEDYEDGVHVLRGGMQLRCVDARPAHFED